LWHPDAYKDQSRPVANRLRPEPVKTSLVTAKDCKRPVCCSSVWFFEVSRIGRTGYGYGLRHWALKDWTGPDFQTLDRSDDNNVDMVDDDFNELPGLEPVDSSECGDEGNDGDDDEEEEEEESAEAELCKFIIDLECH